MRMSAVLPAGLSVIGVHNVGPLAFGAQIGYGASFGPVLGQDDSGERHSRLFFWGGGNSMAVLGRRRPPRAKSHKTDPPVVCPGG